MIYYVHMFKVGDSMLQGGMVWRVYKKNLQLIQGSNDCFQVVAITQSSMFRVGAPFFSCSSLLSFQRFSLRLLYKRGSTAHQNDTHSKQSQNNCFFSLSELKFKISFRIVSLKYIVFENFFLVQLFSIWDHCPTIKLISLHGFSNTS